MPSEQSTWLIAVPNNGDAEGIQQELASSLRPLSSSITELTIPLFKTGTLESLISISEELPKHESFVLTTVSKTVDTLRNLLNNDPSKLSQHILVNDNSIDDYLLNGWRWNEGRYRVKNGLKEIVDTLSKEVVSIDNAMKSKLNSYNLIKGSLVQMQRRKTGNLSVRSLVGIVSSEDTITDSEYMESLFVAIPNNAVKQWNSSYERLSMMVVPRSSKIISSDSEYTLFSVVIFRRVHDDFVQKCRENKFIVRDFVYSADDIVKQQEEFQTVDLTEKELWTELLRLARTNFSEAFQILVHLKVVRLFVESVLRYGLPASYLGLVVKPDPKQSTKTFNILQKHFAYLRPHSKGARGSKAGNAEEFVGEYQTLLEQDFFDFVLYEVPWITID